MADSSKYTKIISIELNSSDLVNELAKINVQQTQLRDSQQELNKKMKEGSITQDEYSKSTVQNQEAMKALHTQARQYSSELQNNIKIAKSAEEAYNKLSAQYANNVAKMDAMSKADLEQTESGKRLTEQTQKLRQEMIQLKEQQGNHTLSVGNYAKAFNGLNLSVSQIVRELPNAAQSAQIFFMSISNNIAGLGDAIQLVKAQNEALAAQGQKTTPVWKQVASALFSWQTALMLGVTAMTIFGPKIVEAIASLFKMKDALDVAKESQAAFNKINEDYAKSATSELSKLELLYKSSQNHAKSLQERNSAIKQLKSEYPEYFGQMTNEQILTGKASTAYNELRASIIEVSKARAAEKIIGEYQEKILKNEIIATEKKNGLIADEIELTKLKTNQREIENNGLLKTAKALGAVSTETDMNTYTKPVDLLNKKVLDTKNAIKDLTNENEKYNQIINNIASGVNVSKLNTDFGRAAAKNKQSETDRAAKEAEKRLKKITADWNEFLGITLKVGKVITTGSDIEQPESETDGVEAPELITKKQILQEKMNNLKLQAENEIYLAQNNEDAKNQILIDAAQKRLDILNGLNDEEREEIFGTQSAYVNAVLSAENEKQKAIEQTRESSQKATEQQLSALGDMFGAMSSFLEAFSGQNEAMAALSKGLALVEIGLNTAKAISGAIAAAQSVPFPGNIVAIATGITSVLTAMVQAKQALSATKMPKNDVKSVKKPKFHTGGDVIGVGEVDATLLAGERVMTTAANAQFSAALSAIESAATGNQININNYQGGQGMEFFKQAFASALREQKQPIVSVQDIIIAQERIKLNDTLVKN